VLAVVAFVVAISVPAFLRPFDLQDEQLIVVYADQIGAGRLPHIDFFTVYGPGTFAAVAGGFAVFGPTVEVERAVGLIYHLALVLSVMALGGRSGRRTALFAGALCALALLPVDLIAYAWVGGLALIVAGTALLANRSSTAAAVAAGALAGLVPLMRPEMLLIAVGSAVPLLWGQRRATPYGLGLVAGLLPFTAYLMWTGPQIWQNVFVSRLAADARLSLSSLTGAALVGAILSCAAAATVVFQAVRTRDRTLATCALLALGVLPQTFQRLDIDHVAFGLCVTAPLAAIALAYQRGHDPRRTSLALAAMTSIIAILAVYSYMQRPIPQTRHVSADGHSMPLTVEVADSAEKLVTLVHDTAPQGDRLFIGAKDMSSPTLSRVGLYHLFPEYEAASYFLELPPGVAERSGSRLADDIASADVLVLTEVPPELNQRLFPNFPAGSQAANDVVSQHFCAAGTNPLGDVYRRCK
jgi:hypothetical protein